MTCDELVRYLSDYVDQRLDEALHAAADEHLATCRNCRVVLDTTRHTIFLYRQRGRVGIPTASRERLVARLEDAFRRRTWSM